MNELGEHLIQVRALAGLAELKALAAAAAADDHKLVAPTDVVWRGEQIVGYASLGAIPMMHTWVKTGAVRPRESLTLLNFGENILARSGAKSVIVPCWDGSPFAPYMERMGYAKLGTTTLYSKGL